MAVKTITIDIEAYELLARRKAPKQSFSQVIKERFRARKTGADLLRALGDVGLEDDTLEAIDHQVERRRRSQARAAKL